VNRRVAGFSLLEALVALAIAALCLGGAIEMQHQLVSGQRRHEAALKRVELQRNALLLLRNINPMETDIGEMPLEGGMTLTFVAEPIGEMKTATGVPRGDGTFNVRLYRIDAEARAPNGALIHSFSVERLGWENPAAAVPF